jgi:hypothetical protein
MVVAPGKLTIAVSPYIYPYMRYSTTQVAKMLKLQQPNLQKLIREKRIPFPPIVRVGGVRVRLWSKRDVARVRKLLAARTKKETR